MDGFTAVLDRHILYLLFLDGFSIKREYGAFMALFVISVWVVNIHDAWMWCYALPSLALDSANPWRNDAFFLKLAPNVIGPSSNAR